MKPAIRLFFYILLILPAAGLAQNTLPIGGWATHLPFNAGLSLTQSPEHIYYATEYAILQIRKSDLSTRKFTRTEGLNGSSIAKIYYHPEAGCLVVAYTDGLIDLVFENEVRSVPDIKIFNNVPIIKNIRSISRYNENEVFINADYGLSSLNVRTGRIAFTLFTPGIRINQTLVYQDQLYMATDKGFYRFALKGGGLVQDFNSWKLLGAESGLNPGLNYTGVAEFEGDLFVASATEGIRMLQQDQFELVYSSQSYTVQYLKSGKNGLTAGLSCRNCNYRIAYAPDGVSWQVLDNDCTSRHLDSEIQDDGRIWLADERWGFRYLDSWTANCNALFVNGPFNKEFFEIKSLSDGIYIASGGIDAVFTYVFRADGIYTYKENKWDVINAVNVPLFAEKDIRDILRVAEHPDKNKIYYASFQRGIVEFDRTTGQYQLFNQTNSALGVAQGDETRVRVIGLDFSPRDKSLWALAYLAQKPLVSLNAAGQWKAYELPGFSTEVSEVKVDLNGYKWIVPRRELGIMVFDEGNPDDPRDDRSIILNTGNSNLQSNKVYTVEVDQDGDVWVGTAMGPVVFECGSSVFSGNCKGSRRKVDQDGIIGFLLETEEVLSIAVDGGDRKWFGTRNGVYVQNPVGDVQVYNFNTRNSPLLGNTIYDIGVDQKTGEVWIGSENGIQVFRSEATAARNSFIEEISSFPNPVPPDYTGPIAIRGLARDARVKITDVSGRLVFETFATGGQALWYGKDYLGNPVAAGTYLIFANSTKDFDTSEGLAGKIVVVR